MRVCYNFAQFEDVNLPQFLGSSVNLQKKCMCPGLDENKLLNIFYNRLTKISNSYQDSMSGNI